MSYFGYANFTRAHAVFANTIWNSFMRSKWAIGLFTLTSYKADLTVFTLRTYPNMQLEETPHGIVWKRQFVPVRLSSTDTCQAVCQFYFLSWRFSKLIHFKLTQSFLRVLISQFRIAETCVTQDRLFLLLSLPSRTAEKMSPFGLDVGLNWGHPNAMLLYQRRFSQNPRTAKILSWSFLLLLVAFGSRHSVSCSLIFRQNKKNRWTNVILKRKLDSGWIGDFIISMEWSISYCSVLVLTYIVIMKIALGCLCTFSGCLRSHSRRTISAILFSRRLQIPASLECEFLNVARASKGCWFSAIFQFADNVWFRPNAWYFVSVQIKLIPTIVFGLDVE